MPLVGRERESATLRGLLDRAAAGHGGLVLLSGEPGIGKRTLLADLTDYARSTGAVVLTGRAVEGSGPYRAVSDALLPQLRAGRIRETPELRPFRGVLGRVLPGWSRPEPPEAGVDPVLMLGEAVLRLLLSLPGPVRVLVLDDLQSADPDTLALLGYLAPAVAEVAVLVVGRQTEPPPAPALDGMPATRIRLARLSDGAIGELVDGVRPLPAPIRDEIVQRAEGLPLAATALIESLPDHVEPHRLPAVPDSYAALVAARLVRLDPDGRRLLAAAAVLGAPSTWSLVPALADLDEATAATGYRRALGLGLLVAEAGSLRWPHPLVRDAVWTDLLPLERDRLNSRAADLLLSLDTDDGNTAAAERLALAGQNDRAAEVLARLARQALDRGGVHRAEEWLRRAAELGRPVAVARLSVELLVSTGRPAEALEVGEPALAEARHEEHADLCLQLAAAAVEAGQWARAEELANRAGRPDDPRTLLVRADAAHGAGRVAEAAELVDRAMASARTAPPAVRCEAGCVRGRILRLSDPAAAREAFTAAAQTASEHGLARWRVEALFGVGSLELLADERSPALQEAHLLAGRLGLVGQQVRAEILLADGLMVTDGPAAMAEPGTALIGWADRLRMPGYAFVGRLFLAVRAAVSGDRATMEDHFERLGDLDRIPPDNRSLVPATRALAALVDHDVAAAKVLLDEAARPLVEHGSTSPLFHFGLWPVVAALTDGAAERARSVVAGRPGVLRRATRGALGYADAIVAGRTGRADEAERAFAAGDALLAGVGWWQRFLRLFTLEAALADGWGGPIPLLRADLGAYEQGGDHRLARIARDLLRQAGTPVRRGRGDAVVPPQLRAAGVTSRELDVLSLLDRGLTNAAISERLFLSPRTVETHVANLLLKSGTSNRQQLRDWLAAQTP
jgi:DNA-binding CsgD family transcriptional regulator/tetratricopeptide (TPR) repeat protein